MKERKDSFARGWAHLCFPVKTDLFFYQSDRNKLVRKDLLTVPRWETHLRIFSLCPPELGKGAGAAGLRGGKGWMEDSSIFHLMKIICQATPDWLSIESIGKELSRVGTNLTGG